MNQESIIKRSFLVNIFLVFLKIFSGIVFHSVSLVADGIHSISDLLTDVFVLLGIRKSKQPADKEHPIGHGKFEYILSLFLGVFVLFVAYNIIRGVIYNWGKEIEIPNALSLIVVIIVIVLKFLLSKYLIKKGKETKSQIISASGKESFTDVLSSFFVLIGIGLVLIGERFNINMFLYGDKLASIIIALFILKIGFEISKRSVKLLMGESVSEEIKQEYIDKINSVEGVINIRKIDIIEFGPYYQILVNIVVDGNITVYEGHDIANSVHYMLLDEEKVCYVIVHVDPHKRGAKNE